MKKIIVLLFAVLPMVAMAQQVFIVDVSVLSERTHGCGTPKGCRY